MLLGDFSCMIQPITIRNISIEIVENKALTLRTRGMQSNVVWAIKGQGSDYGRWMRTHPFSP